jgi:hypothetical protein
LDLELLPHQCQFLLRSAQIDVNPSHFGCRHEPYAMHGFFGRTGVLAGCQGQQPCATKEIKFPTGIEAELEDTCFAGNAGQVGDPSDTLGKPATEALRTGCGREVRALGGGFHTSLSACFPNPRQGDANVKVRVEGAFHEVRQLRVMKVCPPGVESGGLW